MNDNECLRCKQDQEFQQSLNVDRLHQNLKPLLPTKQITKPDESTVLTDSTPECTQDLRQRRLDHFNKRNVQAPLRYRHSIGSPSLSLNNSVGNPLEESVVPFGNEEVDRFFESSNIAENISSEDIQPQQEELDLAESLAVYNSKSKQIKTVILQRDIRFFWKILFRQNLDLSVHSPNVRFAGEAAADAGGPLREFFTLAMQRFKELPSMTFGGNESVCFTCDAESVLSKKYFMVGQICGVSILTLGRGPECIHPAIVRALFKVEQPEEIEEVDDSNIKRKLLDIEQGNYDPVYDLNISPLGKSTVELKRLFLISTLVHTRYSSIEQFRDGLKSISENLVKKNAFDATFSFYVNNKSNITFNQMMNLFSYPQKDSLPNGSNELEKIIAAITEFEMLLSEIESNIVYLSPGNLMTFNHLLFFCTGVDKIPPYGFEKLIEVTFEGNKLPRASTCCLEVTFPLPLQDNEHMPLKDKLIIAINYGGGFGDI